MNYNPPTIHYSGTSAIHGALPKTNEHFNQHSSPATFDRDTYKSIESKDMQRLNAQQTIYKSNFREH
jgi:hypothetical protein